MESQHSRKLLRYDRGDASMTRADFFIGDNHNFQEALYNEDLAQLAKFGDHGPDGPHTVFNLKTLIAMKNHTIMPILKSVFLRTFFRLADQNPVRISAVPNERSVRPKRFPPQASFFSTTISTKVDHHVISVFANGATKQATLPVISSFFRNQTFPKNWFCATSLVTRAPTVSPLFSGVSVAPGKNKEHDVYVADPSPPTLVNVTLGCSAYRISKKNVELLRSMNRESGSNSYLYQVSNWIRICFPDIRGLETTNSLKIRLLKLAIWLDENLQRWTFSRPSPRRALDTEVSSSAFGPLDNGGRGEKIFPTYSGTR
ncbi:hypothetical protein C8J56DRAFT_901764 [Mycena floridula]|nr:hypothetical protein C8J56DRAFT_901764 [Mycena floridula]